MVFGVPLETLLRGHPTDGIPAVLFKCIQALNARGLQKEGLYRMSGKKSEMTELKRQLEHDVHAVDLMTEKWDVHSIANLVKLYLRQLPVPVFPFPPAERSAYAELGEAERVTLLRGKINALPRGHLTVLKYLVDHLSRVIQQSAYNKMTGPNLSLIFGPIMFQEQMEAISPEALQAPGGPISHFFQKSETRLPAAAERLDLTQYQLFKTDAVCPITKNKFVHLTPRFPKSFLLVPPLVVIFRP
ncbi:Rho GTPase activation protein [Powellomyces hirtus]|nr:Rho GTPase activation protein [Powellomyces hirtus]